MNRLIRRDFLRARSLAAPVMRALAAVAFALAALTCVARLAAAAPDDHKFVSLRGRVVDPSGNPLSDVVIEATGSIEANGLTGPDGRFGLMLDLGTLRKLQRAPARLSIWARLDGNRVIVAGGEPSLAFEVGVRARDGQPVMETRSNFGLIADALLDALAIPGERTAVLQVRFIGDHGAPIEKPATLPDELHSHSIDEPWLIAPPPAVPQSPPAAPARAAAPQSPPQARVAPPPAKIAPPVAAPAQPSVENGAPPPLDIYTPRKPGSSKKHPKPAPAPKVASAKPQKPKLEKVAATKLEEAPPLPAPASNRTPVTRADSLRLAKEAERREEVASAAAVRDSIWRVQHAQSLARKAVVDSLRAVRDAAEDSARRAQFGLAPRPAADTLKYAKQREAAIKRNREIEQQQAARERRRLEEARKSLARNERRAQRSLPAQPASESSAPAAETEPAPAPAPPVSLTPRVSANLPPSSGLKRVEPGAHAVSGDENGADARARLEADTCGCVVRGTVEMEFHRLLSSPMKIEVSITELPALRDTIELFMGSPRAFEMRRVPCGRWSLTLHPFSERPFGVTTPEEVAPFDCRQRSLRQVRIVIAPL